MELEGSKLKFHLKKKILLAKNSSFKQGKKYIRGTRVY